MRRPIKRKIELRRDYLYLLKDGTKAIFYCYWGPKTQIALFRRQRRIRLFHLPYWNRKVVKRLREKTDNE